ncbi:unnamed protein product [Caenorhabditis sp. 36 PRJEB53466]|nr:unnamed protein product [Caenorhabditis sp. 36 PRJEB53466]
MLSIAVFSSCILLVFSEISVISIEYPLRNKRFCERIPLKLGAFDDPLAENLIRNGCEPPVRQNELEASFRDALLQSSANASVFQQIQTLAKRGFVDWQQTFKQKHLDISSTFSGFDGFLFVEDFFPICANSTLSIRICFTKNPTRKFGKPKTFEMPDGKVFQLDFSTGSIATSNCTVMGNSARCWAFPNSFVFRFQRDSSGDSSMLSSDYWTLSIIIAIVSSVLLLSLLPITLLIYCRFCSRKKLENREKEPADEVRDPERLFGTVLIDQNFPFIDDNL